MDRFDKIIYSIGIIAIVGALIHAFIDNGNIKETLSEGCKDGELTDWRVSGMGYEIECDGNVQDKICYIESRPYCAERNKWGDCTDRDRHPKELNCQ